MAMSNVLAGLVLVLPILFLIPFGLVYAEIPTYNDEFDFNFTEIEIFQDPDNLKNLIIKTNISFDGMAELGSANIEFIITDPEGYQHTPEISRVNEMSIGAIEPAYWNHYLTMEGTYTIDLVMTNTSLEYPGHIFVQTSIDYTVKKDSFKKMLNSNLSEDVDGNKIFTLRNIEDIKRFELIQVIFDLPETHSFEKIGVLNGNFTKTFSIDKPELLLKSQFGYADMQLYLIKEGSILPFADAQSEFLDYVTFYSINRDVCYSKNCEPIDYIPPLQSKQIDEFMFFEHISLWLLLLIIPVIIIIVAFVIKFVRKTKFHTTIEDNNIDSDITNDDKNSEYEIVHRD